jgi:hypothetical protein
LRTPALARPAPDAPKEVATVENNTMRIAVAPKSVLALALLCATPAADLRTYDVRSDVRFGTAQGAATQSVRARRVRMSAPTTGMGHVGTAQIAFGAGTVPGSQTWSPPI